MALPFLATATTAMRTFWTAAVRGVREGLSANRTIRAFLSAGNKIRRADALRVFRIAQGIDRTGKALGRIKRGTRLFEEVLAQTAFETRRRFTYTVKITGLDAKGGVVEATGVTISSDNALSRDTIEDAALEAAEENQYDDVVQPLEVELVYGLFSTSF